MAETFPAIQAPRHQELAFCAFLHNVLDNVNLSPHRVFGGHIYVDLVLILIFFKAYFLQVSQVWAPV
jgi:hypothetical protein